MLLLLMMMMMMEGGGGVDDDGGGSRADVLIEETRQIGREKRIGKLTTRQKEGKTSCSIHPEPVRKGKLECGVTANPQQNHKWMQREGWVGGIVVWKKELERGSG